MDQYLTTHILLTIGLASMLQFVLVQAIIKPIPHSIGGLIGRGDESGWGGGVEGGGHIGAHIMLILHLFIEFHDFNWLINSILFAN